MATETELWGLITSRREGVLTTIRRDGLPQLSNVLYLPGPGGRTARISTTADRLKARILARDPRAVLHVTGDNLWAYAVAEGYATLTPLPSSRAMKHAGSCSKSTRRSTVPGTGTRSSPRWSPAAAPRDPALPGPHLPHHPRPPADTNPWARAEVTRMAGTRTAEIHAISNGP
jgi:PPOX class probable F420-dependent enzyme